MLECHNLVDHRAVDLMRDHLIEGRQKTVNSVAESLD